MKLSQSCCNVFAIGGRQFQSIVSKAPWPGPPETAKKKKKEKKERGKKKGWKQSSGVNFCGRRALRVVCLSSGSRANTTRNRTMQERLQGLEVCRAIELKWIVTRADAPGSVT